eukprot:1986446-Amphidinium_carterae.1
MPTAVLGQEQLDDDHKEEYCEGQFNTNEEAKSTTKNGLEIDSEDEKKKLEELKVEIEPLTKLMKEVCEKVGLAPDSQATGRQRPHLAQALCIFAHA